VEAVLKDPSTKEKIVNHLLEHIRRDDYDFYLRFLADREKAVAYLDAQIKELESPD
jgi:hypothetical protein